MLTFGPFDVKEESADSSGNKQLVDQVQSFWLANVLFQQGGIRSAPYGKGILDLGGYPPMATLHSSSVRRLQHVRVQKMHSDRRVILAPVTTQIQLWAEYKKHGKISDTFFPFF